jgi:hypothetical protein
LVSINAEALCLEAKFVRLYEIEAIFFFIISNAVVSLKFSHLADTARLAFAGAR